MWINELKWEKKEEKIYVNEKVNKIDVKANSWIVSL